MSNYLCKHGYMYSACTLCGAIAEAIEDYMMRPMPIESDEMSEMMYDSFLDEDERILRESEEF